MSKCPNCGFNLSKTERSRRVTKQAKEEFIRRNESLLKKEGISNTVIWLARHELNYSTKTVREDIAASLQKTYARIFLCKTCGDPKTECHCVE